MNPAVALATLPPMPALVPGRVRHHRLHPISHRVAMTTHLWLVDLAEANPRRFRPRDHFEAADPRPIQDKLLDCAAGHGLASEPGDRLVMLAGARSVGHVFNPLSVHWCVAPDGTMRWAILEVHNTYHSRHAYPLVPDHAGRSTVDKAFYVSPFFTVDGTYRVTLRLDAGIVAVGITLEQQERTVFTASFTGQPTRPDRRSRALAALRTPLATHQTSARIRAHGLWLWLRRLPVVPRDSAPQDARQPAPDRDWAEVDRPRRAPLRGRVARTLVTRAVRDLPLRVELPGGQVLGSGGPADPVLRIHTEAFFDRIGSDHTIGVGEGYLAGEWGPAPGTDLAEALTPLAARLPQLVPAWLKRFRRVVEARQPRAEGGHRSGARANISRHYDLSNALFATFLDETMSYSGAWFADPDEDLASAQRRKVDGILDLAGVTDGTRVLEIGTGWGQLALQAADRGARVRSITLSSEQRNLAAERVAGAGHDDRVELALEDYREVSGSFDAVASVEMIEAVGHDYWDEYFATVARVLAPGGRFGLQAITMPHPAMLSSRHAYTWIHKYVFPGGLIPSVTAIEQAAGRAGLVVTDRRSLGADYARTLREWRQRFTDRAADVEALGFDARFRDVWEFYLAYSEAGFRAGYLDLWQFGLTAAGPTSKTTRKMRDRPAKPPRKLGETG